MIVPKPLRMVGIVVCGVALAAPGILCFGERSPGLLKIVDFVRTLFPLWFVLLVQLSIDEGRARERAARGIQKED
ncbi:hypothetical protein [Sorangium sp. So ce1000]|uniref:hypothetical protein n=1 Tax=Sorangium sp. So ce1000 TaxID=3133325 RepID=UPI003F638BEC